MKTDVLKRVAEELLQQNIDNANNIIKEEYPFELLERKKRTYSDNQKMKQFVKDGFIDRYTGQKLVNPGILKVISHYLPKEFPYHPNWKMDCCHMAYWEFVPTLDHIYPIALGGEDNEDNYATTSMLHNNIKTNWTLEQLNWKLHPPGDINEWDGLTELFLELVRNDSELLKDNYIKKWYKLSELYL